MESKLEKLNREAIERAQSREVKLPNWPETKRGTPNSFLRSALFSAIQSKNRVYLSGVVLASHGGFVLKYTGQQLNQEDLLLWETLVHLARHSPLGDVCEFTAYEILRSLSLNTGINEYSTLHAGIMRLTACSVEINKEGESRGFFGPLIEFGENHDLGSTAKYRLKLSRTLTKLYKDNTCWVDFGRRLQLRKKPLAQFLHGYYSSHAAPYPVKVETLHKLSGSGTKRQAAFKQNLKSALDELVEIGFLIGYELIDGVVTVKRS